MPLVFVPSYGEVTNNFCRAVLIRTSTIVLHGAPFKLVGFLKQDSSATKQASPETSSRTVNANDKSWCFSTQFGFGCLDLAFLNNC